jgi:hypothetical protein
MSSSEYLEKIAQAEASMGVKLPQDFINFFEEYEGMSVMNGEWFTIADLGTADLFDIPEFEVMQNLPENLFKQTEYNKLVPVLSDNDGYVIIDTRENGLGVFVIWSDEENLEYQNKTFTEFVNDIRQSVDSGENLNCNYLDPYEYD